MSKQLQNATKLDILSSCPSLAQRLLQLAFTQRNLGSNPRGGTVPICKHCNTDEVVNSGRCRKCYNDYMREYMLTRFHRLMDQAKQELGGQCRSCGSEEDLQLDHIDWREKSIDIGKLWSCSSEKIKQELVKCQLLCAPCHIEKTKIDHAENRAARGLRSWNEIPDEAYRHGTPRMGLYRKCHCGKCKEAVRAYKKKLIDLSGKPRITNQEIDIGGTCQSTPSTSHATHFKSSTSTTTSTATR